MLKFRESKLYLSIKKRCENMAKKKAKAKPKTKVSKPKAKGMCSCGSGMKSSDCCGC